MAGTLPDYLTENADGSMTVRLRGADQRTITLREPTVGDQLVVAEMRGSDAAKEVALVANLAEIAPDEVHALSLRNYARVQEALGFLQQ